MARSLRTASTASSLPPPRADIEGQRMAEQIPLRDKRREHARSADSGNRTRRRHWHRRRRYGLLHRLEVNGLQARLLLLELVERRVLTGQSPLQLSGECCSVGDGGRPRQRVCQLITG